MTNMQLLILSINLKQFPLCSNTFPLFWQFSKWFAIWISVNFEAKISVTKFRKSKIWDDSLKVFFIGFMVLYSILSVNAFFREKFAKQNGPFSTFWENPKKAVIEWQISPPRIHPRIFQWSHLLGPSERIILEPRTFIKGIKKVC